MRKENFKYLLFLVLLFSFFGNSKIGFANQDNKFELSKQEWEKMQKNSYVEDFVEKEKTKSQPSSLPTFNGGLSILKPLSYILLAVFILLALFFIVRNTINMQKFRKKDKDLEFLIENMDEQIHEINLDELLSYALKNQMFNLAIRIRYLMIIKLLSERKLINWTKDKTNGQYLQEMRSNKYFNGFREITVLFEKVWYGDIVLIEPTYFQYSPYFENFLNIISNRD